MSAGGAATLKLDPALWLGAESASAWLDFVREAQTEGKSPRTIQSYGEALADLARHLGAGEPGAEVIEAGKREITSYLLWVQGARSHSTRAARQRSLSAWFRWAAEFGGILPTSEPPTAKIKRDKGTQTVRRVLDVAELKRVEATTATPAPTPAAEFTRLRDRAILALFREAGCPRIAEMSGMDIADVDLAKAVVLIHGKGRKDRLIGMSRGTAVAVSQYLRARRRWTATHRIPATVTALWLGCAPGRNKQWGFTVSGIAKMITARGNDAGIAGLHAHLFRHTAYSRFLEAGGNAGDAMELFGWADDTMLRHYGKDAASRRATAWAGRANIADI